MLRRIVSAFAAFVLLFQVPIVGTSEAYADGGSSNSFPFFTSVDLVDAATGNILGGADDTPVDKDAQVKIRYYFTIPDDVEIEAGDSYTFDIPDQIKIDVPLTNFELKSGETVFAHLDVTADGHGKITFTDAVSTMRGVGGTFDIGAQFDKENIGNTEIVKIPFVINGENKDISVHFNQPEALNAKTGEYDAATGVVTWTISLNSNETTVKGATLTDVIAPGKASDDNDQSQTYVEGTFKVQTAEGVVLFDSSSVGSENRGEFIYTPATNDPAQTGTISYTFDKTFEEAVTVTYQTRVADPSQYFGTSISNEAILSHDQIDQNIAGSATVPQPDYLTKSGVYNEETKKIDWTILFNKEALDLHGVKLTDTLTGGLILDASSVKLDGNPVSSGDDETVNTFSYNSATGEFVYRAGDINAAHTLTFSTDLPAGYWQQNHAAGEFSNTAVMTSTDNSYLKKGAGSTSGKVGPGNSVIKKSTLGYDAENHLITWQIVVNKDQKELPDATIEDTIPAGLKYLADSFQITPGAPNNISTGAQSFAGEVPANPSTSPTKLTYHFGEITDSYTITYKTEVVDAAVWAGNSNKNYVNTVQLTPGGTFASSTGEATQNVTNSTAKKSATYDYTTHELTWNIVVNASEVPLTKVKVSDALTGEGLDDFTFIAGSVTVDGVSATASDSVDPEVGSYHYGADDKTLIVNLGDLNGTSTESRSKTVTFKMKLAKEGADFDEYFSKNGDKTIGNTAIVSSEQNPSTQAKGTQVISNKMVDKTGYYSNGRAYIDWAVQVNQNQVSMKDAVLTDVLQEGLELDTSSVKLYRQTLQPDGTLSPSASYDDTTAELSVVGGVSESLGSENVAYDATTRTFTLTLPESVGDGQPCLVVFRTTVDVAHAQGTTFSNSISLAGSGYVEKSSSSDQEVHFATIDGEAWGETGEVYLSKTDQATNEPLSGAVFGLYDSFGNLVRISEPTNSDGSSVFSHINYNTLYSVQEITAPADYTLGDASYTFKLSKTESGIHLYDKQGNALDESRSDLSFVNNRKVGTITFVKTGDGDNPLAGAEFTLCNEAGEAVEGFESQVSGPDGRVTFDNVPYGTYLVKETGAPVGYEAISFVASLHDDNDAIVTEGGSHTLDLGSKHDAPIGSLTLTKYRAEFEGASTQPMSGVSFEVLDETGTTVVREAQQTDSDGKIAFEGLEPGSYILRETETPADYAPADDYAFTIDASSTPLERQLTHEITNVKRSGEIVLTKVDAADGVTPLAGASFTLYDAAGENIVSNAEGPLVVVSDAQGIVRFENVPYGDYLVKETQNPANYYGNVSVGASLHTSTNSLGVAENARSTGTIRFVKTDGNAPLAGAVFELSGNGIDPLQATSDADGVVEFVGIPYQDTPYTVSEVAAPADYYRVVDDFQVTINDESTALSQGDLVLADPVVDIPFGSIELTKTNEDGSALLSGAVFELLDGEGTVVQTQETDASGYLCFDDLALKPTGDTVFTVHEKRAPLGYELAADQTVTLAHESGVRSASVEVRDVLKTDPISPATTLTQTGDGLTGIMAGFAALVVIAGSSVAIAVVRRLRKKA